MKHLLAWNGCPWQGGSTGEGWGPKHSARSEERALVWWRWRESNPRPEGSAHGSSTSVVGRCSRPGPHDRPRGCPGPAAALSHGARPSRAAPRLCRARPTPVGGRSGRTWPRFSGGHCACPGYFTQPRAERQHSCGWHLLVARLFYEGDAPRLAIRGLPLPSKPFIPTMVRCPMAFALYHEGDKKSVRIRGNRGWTLGRLHLLEQGSAL